jgi:hypothetical protein
VAQRQDKVGQAGKRSLGAAGASHRFGLVGFGDGDLSVALPVLTRHAMAPIAC